MPLYVIEPDHPLPPTYGEYETVLRLADGDQVVLTPGAEIAAHGRYSWGIIGGPNVRLSIDGRVHSAWDTAIGVHGSINIGAAGVVQGGFYGIELYYLPALATPILTNAGTISGGSTAVWLP